MFNLFCRCYARMKVDLKNEICELLVNHNHLPMIEIDNSSIDVSNDVQRIETNRGGVSLVMEGKKFIKCANHKGTAHYRCQFYTRKCKCRISISDGIARMSNFHNHD